MHGTEDGPSEWSERHLASPSRAPPVIPCAFQKASTGDPRFEKPSGNGRRRGEG